MADCAAQSIQGIERETQVEMGESQSIAHNIPKCKLTFERGFDNENEKRMEMQENRIGIMQLQRQE